jgi:hypothetical protein
MKRWGKWGVLALAAVGVAVACRVVVSQQPVAPPGQPPAPNPLAVLFERARPHVEEALGVKLDPVPEFRAVSAGELASVPDFDLEMHLTWHCAHLRGETMARTRQVARQILGRADVAHYVEGGPILVATDNLPKIAEWDGELKPVTSEAFQQLALVHEAVRCHLDRQYHLGKLRAGCRDAEEYDALHALVEGRAQEVTEAVARKLGSEAVFPLLALRYLRVPDEAPDPSLKAVSQTALHARQQACARGLAFFLTLRQAGLREQFAFANMPRQLTVLAQPERWMEALHKQQPDLASVLQPLEATLPAADWQPMQQTWTPAMLGQVAGMLGVSRERADKVAATWYEGRTLVWAQRGHPERQVAVNVVRHNTGAGARAYFNFAVDLQRKQDTLPPGSCGPMIRVVESKSTGVKLEGFDEAVRNDKRIAFGGAEATPVSLLLARTGDLVIECTWHGQTADAALAERLVQTVRTAAR